MPRSKRIYEGAVLLTVIIWGLNFPVVKAALIYMHPYVFNALRLTCSVIFIAAVWAFSSERPKEALSQLLRKHGWKILLLGLTGHFFYQLGFISGLDRTTAGNSALLISTAPLWTAVCSHLTRIERLKRLGWLGLWIAFGGTILIVWAGPKALSLADSTMLGNLITLFAAMLWGAYTTFSKSFVEAFTPTLLTLLSIAVAIPGLWGVAVPFLPEVVWTEVPLGVWAAIIFSGLLATGLAYVFWNLAIKHIGPAHTAAFGNLVPVIALVSGYIFLGESITSGQILGGVLIIVGLLVLRKART